MLPSLPYVRANPSHDTGVFRALSEQDVYRLRVRRSTLEREIHAMAREFQYLFEHDAFWEALANRMMERYGIRF